MFRGARLEFVAPLGAHLAISRTFGWLLAHVGFLKMFIELFLQQREIVPLVAHDGWRECYLWASRARTAHWCFIPRFRHDQMRLFHASQVFHRPEPIATPCGFQTAPPPRIGCCVRYPALYTAYGLSCAPPSPSGSRPTCFRCNYTMQINMAIRCNQNRQLHPHVLLKVFGTRNITDRVRLLQPTQS